MNEDIIRFATPRRQARASLQATWLAGGTLEIYSEPIPADGDGAITTQVLLVVFALPDPVGVAANGIITAATIPAGLTLATGTAKFGRAKDSAGVSISDYLVGLPNTGYAIGMDNLSLVAGALATITSFVIAEG